MEDNKKHLEKLLDDLVGRKTDYSYTDLLDYFDSRYECDNERTNYAHVINSMKNENNVEALIKTYNKVLYKLLIFAHGSVEEFPSLWVKYGITNGDQWVWDDLIAFLNDQIIRVFDETPYSDHLALECVTNLREGRNDGAIRRHIASKSSEEVNSLLQQITDCKKTVQDAPQHMSKFNMETNGYREYKPKYIDDIKFLIKNGYYKDIKDVYFEMQTKVSNIPNTKSLIKLVLLLLITIPIAIVLIYAIGKGILFVLIILALLSYVWKGR